MKLPEKLTLSVVMFADGANGYKIQEYENKEFGIKVKHEKMNKLTAWTTTFTTSLIPGKQFKAYADIKKALEALPE